MEKNFTCLCSRIYPNLKFAFRKIACGKCISCILVILLTLTGCNTEPVYAPVTDGWLQPLSTQGVHVVSQGETLYSIAWRYGRDYRDLARINQIKAPYHLTAGQHIRLVAGKDAKAARVSTSSVALPPKAVVTAPTNKLAVGKAKDVPANNKPVIVAAEAKKAVAVEEQTETVAEESPAISTTGWNWPAKGKVLSSYASTNGANKGIDIAGKLGAPVRATAAGKVVYSGNGLRGYGELIIIKHNDEYLSAYAHNRKLLVHEGAQVKAGQVIAEMGDTEAKQVMLHFEIRKAGKPVDPMQYLATTD